MGNMVRNASSEIIHSFAGVNSTVLTTTVKYVALLFVILFINKTFADAIATPEQLHKVNTYLINYWRQGCLITINWSPNNPWLNDETQIEKNSGVWTDTRSNGGDMSKVDLRELMNANSPMRAIWLRKICRRESPLRLLNLVLLPEVS